MKALMVMSPSPHNRSTYGLPQQEVCFSNANDWAMSLNWSVCPKCRKATRLDLDGSNLIALTVKGDVKKNFPSNVDCKGVWWSATLLNVYFLTLCLFACLHPLPFPQITVHPGLQCRRKRYSLVGVLYRGASRSCLQSGSSRRICASLSAFWTASASLCTASRAPAAAPGAAGPA